MKKINVPLAIGCVILILLLAVMLFPKLFTNKSPYNTQNMKMSYDEAGKLVVEKAPYPPSQDYFMGSDDMGRDIFSYIIYGTRLTIILGIMIALGRFVISVPLALIAGLGSKTLKSLIKIFGVMFSAVPAVLIGLIILQLEYFTKLDRTGSTIAFIAVLSFVGWPKLGNLIMERVETINSMPFIRAEVAIGKRRSMIALENIVPHLAPEMLVLYFMEIARSLTMIMTLGIFNIFVGNLKFLASTDFGVYVFFNVSFEPEWASMLSTSRSMLGVAPWAVLFPAMAFFISVLGFNLVGEGLRTQMQKRDYKVIPMMRKIITFDFASLWSNSAKPAKIKAVISAVLVIALLFVPRMIDKATYNMTPTEKYTLSDRVVIGTQQSSQTAELIACSMYDLGIEPLNEGSYYMDYGLEPSNILLEHDCIISTDSAHIKPVANQDYAFVEGGSYERIGGLFDATREDLFNIEDYDKYTGKYVLINKAYYTDQVIDYFIGEISSHADIKGILLIARSDEKVCNMFVKDNQDIFVLLISTQLSEKLLEMDSPIIKVSADTTPIGQTGRNIIGIYKPDEDVLDKEALMIGMNYNYPDERGQQVLRFNLAFMERLCTYHNKRSIIFLFLDGTLSDRYNGVYDITENLPYTPFKVDVYIDLTGIEEPAFDSIEYSDAQSPYIRQYAWSIGNQLKKHFSNNRIGINELESVIVDKLHYFTQSPSLNAMYWKKGIGTVIIRTENKGDKHDIYDIGSILLEVIDKNSY